MLLLVSVSRLRYTWQALNVGVPETTCESVVPHSKRGVLADWSASFVPNFILYMDLTGLDFQGSFQANHN